MRRCICAVSCLLFLLLLPACGQVEDTPAITEESPIGLGLPSPEYDLSAWDGVARLTLTVKRDADQPSRFSIDGLLENISSDVELQGNCFWTFQYCFEDCWYALSFQEDAPPLVHNDINIGVKPGQSIWIQGENLLRPQVYYGELTPGLYRVLGKIGRFDAQQNRYVYGTPIITQFTLE